MTIEETILERLTTELTLPLYDGKTQSEGFAFLNNAVSVVVEDRPMPFTLAELLAILSPESAAKLVDWPMLGDLRDKVLLQDHFGVITWLSFISGTKITAPELAAAYAHLTRTEAVEVRTPVQPRVWNIVRAIPNGPNYVTEEQFAAAWTAAGRS